MARGNADPSAHIDHRAAPIRRAGRFIGEQQFDLQQVPGFPDLWAIPAGHCNLQDGKVYHYWFQVTDTHPERSASASESPIRWPSPLIGACWPRGRMGSAYNDDDRYPAAVVRYSQGRLVACDAGGETGELQNEPPLPHCRQTIAW